MKHLYFFLNDFFQELAFTDFLASASSVIICLTAIWVVAWVVFFITRKISASIIHRMVLKTKSDWDDFLFQRKVFTALSHLPSAFIFYFTYNFSEIKAVDEILLRASLIYFVVITSMVLNRLIRAGLDIYNTTPYAQTRPIKGYAQLLHILVYFVACIFIIAFIAGKSPLWFLTGLGAIAAVLLLVFKDTILGLVASIQLSANNMVKPGDWIEMPNHKADGTVIDISLNTVKVQNGDKTITMIPTYALVSESFNNWKGMEESGGRRIKRSINIDMKSVKFCTPMLLKKLKKFRLIHDYIENKQNEIAESNKSLNIDENDTLNSRRQTNLGIFRKYIEAYLENNPMINKEMTFVVRYLQPTEKGIPLEIYVFSKEQRLNDYELIQADIFDHILAVISEFELNIFQNPTGSDILEFIKKH